MSSTRALAIVIGAYVFVGLAGCKSAQDRVVLGDDYFLEGRFSQAIDQYRRARRKDPAIPGLDDKIQQTQVRLFLQQGDAFIAGQRFDEARGAYGEVRRLDPGNPDLDGRWTRLIEAEAEWHFKQGQQRLASGDPFTAISEFEQAIAILPSHARAAAALDRARRDRAERVARAESAYGQGLEARQLGQFEDAIDYFQRAIELDPTHSGAALELDSTASAYVEQCIDLGDESAQHGLWTQASEYYEKARAYDPSSRQIQARLYQTHRELDAEKWMDQGDRARQREDWRDAYECYEQAHLLTSMPERMQDRFDEARAALVKAYAATARKAERDGRFDDALGGYLAILDVDPHHADAREWFTTLNDKLRTAEAAYREGRAAMRQVDLLQARKHFRECTDTLAGYRDAAEFLENVRRDLDLAETLYNRAVEADRTGRPDRASVLYEECLSVTRPFRDARERLEETQAVAWRDEDRYEPYIKACRAQAERDYESARTLLQRCRKERPGYRDVDQRLEQIGEALDQAAAVYTWAEKAARDNELDTARDAYAECLKVAGGYRDAADRLAAVEASLELLREAQSLERQRRLTDARDRYRDLLKRRPGHPVAVARLRELDKACEALDVSYAQLVEAEQKKDYRDALRQAVLIRNRSAGYHDVDTRIVRLELEADYADARTFEEAGRWELAGRAYERCVQRDADFRDAQERRERCRAHVEQARGSERDWERGGKRRSAQGKSDRD